MCFFLRRCFFPAAAQAGQIGPRWLLASEAVVPAEVLKAGAAYILKIKQTAGGR